MVFISIIYLCFLFKNLIPKIINVLFLGYVMAIYWVHSITVKLLFQYFFKIIFSFDFLPMVIKTFFFN